MVGSKIYSVIFSIALVAVTTSLSAQVSKVKPDKLYTTVSAFNAVGVKTTHKPDQSDSSHIVYIFTNASKQALICAVDLHGSLVANPNGYYFGIISLDAKNRIDHVSIYNKDGKPMSDTSQIGTSEMRMVIMKPDALEAYMTKDSSGVSAEDTTIVAQHLFNTKGEKVGEKPMPIMSYKLFQEMLVPEIFPGKKPGQ